MSTLTQPLTTPAQATPAACRFCGAGLEETFIDLGMSPLCETYPSAAELKHGEMYYPLHAYVCSECFLVQLEEFASGESIFSDYPYFSSYSESWLRHCQNYCDCMMRRFGLGAGGKFVLEVASNDGYLLQYFVKRGVPVLGIEPAANVAEDAIAKGVPTLVRFFGAALADELAAQGRKADLIVGNNVLAQVPDLNDFVHGLSVALKTDGVITLEFPHLLRLIEHQEFDTIYHEHFSYFSMLTVKRILAAYGLKVFDAEELPTHGGSLRVYACHDESKQHQSTQAMEEIIAEEKAAALDTLGGYKKFSCRVKKTKLALNELLISAARAGRSVVGYGAPGKSATLLHYCGIGKDLLEYTVDRNPRKQGRFLPGTHIPIYHPDHIRETKPDYVLILPWNLTAEIIEQMKFIRDWGGRFVVPIPEVRVY